MKHLTLILLIATLFTPTLYAEEHQEDFEEFKRDIERRHMQMELQKQEIELDFIRQTHAMELKERHLKLDRMARRSANPHKKHAPLFIIILIIHVLTAVWTYQDIRQRSRGSGLWIVLSLLAGLLGALVYAVTRIADNKTQT